MCPLHFFIITIDSEVVVITANTKFIFECYKVKLQTLRYSQIIILLQILFCNLKNL